MVSTFSFNASASSSLSFPPLCFSLSALANLVRPALVLREGGDGKGPDYELLTIISCVRGVDDEWYHVRVAWHVLLPNAIPLFALWAALECSIDVLTPSFRISGHAVLRILTPIITD